MNPRIEKRTYPMVCSNGDVWMLDPFVCVVNALEVVLPTEFIHCSGKTFRPEICDNTGEVVFVEDPDSCWE